MSYDIIVGTHSIYHAIKNPDRSNFELFGTKDSIKDFKKKYKLPEVEIHFLPNPGEVFNLAQHETRELGMKVQKIPSNVFLRCSTLPQLGNAWLYDYAEKNESLKFIALDRITDIHNAAAIMRSAAFFEADAVIISMKSSFGLTPTFFRISSGATEHVNIVTTSSLPKTLSKLADKGVNLIGFSEEAENSEVEDKAKSCLVFGSEEFGLSYAVERTLNQHIALETNSEINSLNVSVAAALGMQKVFK